MQTRTGLWRDCVLVIAILGGDVTSAEIHEFMRGEGETFTSKKIGVALASLCRQKAPLIERAVRGRRGCVSTRYRLTERGHAVLAED